MDKSIVIGAKSAVSLAKEVMKSFAEAPVNETLCFVDDPTTGHAWQNVCVEENILANMLKDMPEGTAVEGEGTEIWFLKLNDEGMRELMFYYDGLSAPQSRHGWGLEYVDVGVDDLLDYTEQIRSAIQNFKTKIINIDELPEE